MPAPDPVPQPDAGAEVLPAELAAEDRHAEKGLRRQLVKNPADESQAGPRKQKVPAPGGRSASFWIIMNVIVYCHASSLSSEPNSWVGQSAGFTKLHILYPRHKPEAQAKEGCPSLAIRLVCCLSRTGNLADEVSHGRSTHCTPDRRPAYRPRNPAADFQVEGPLGFVGGQYVIVNTGIPLPGGKVAKRAYSLLSPDSDQQQFQIAVKRIGTGPGSNFMHSLAGGSELTFSGPWGKFFPEEIEPERPTLVFATDTGITAALGLLRSRRFQNATAQTHLIWFVDSLDYFIPESMLRDQFAWNGLPGPSVPDGRKPVPQSTLTRSVSEGASTLVHIGLPVHHPDRPGAAAELVRKLCGESMPQRAFLAGDGAILLPLCEQLKAMGVAEAAIRMECFFNNPFKKAP